VIVTRAEQPATMTWIPKRHAGPWAAPAGGRDLRRPRVLMELVESRVHGRPDVSDGPDRIPINHGPDPLIV